MTATPHATFASDEGVADRAPLRDIAFGTPTITVERRNDGTIYLHPNEPLPDYPVRITDRLHHWAAHAPDRIFVAERAEDGGWRSLTYAQMLAQSRRIASALDRKSVV